MSEITPNDKKWEFFLVVIYFLYLFKYIYEDLISIIWTDIYGAMQSYLVGRKKI